MLINILPDITRVPVLLVQGLLRLKSTLGQPTLLALLHLAQVKLLLFLKVASLLTLHLLMRICFLVVVSLFLADILLANREGLAAAMGPTFRVFDCFCHFY